MKKITLILLTIFALTLTACGASSGTSQPGSTSQSNPGNAPMPLVDQILIGILKLDGTSNAITAKQASDLLPLWQVYKDLSTSSNAAQQEIDALVQQIQGVLTPAQMQAITDMKLTRQDMFATMQQLGIVTGRAPGNGTPSASQNGGGNGFRTGGGGGGGGFPGGGPGGGPGGPPGEQNFTPQQIATAQARRSQGGGFANQIPSGLFDALIHYLEKAAGLATSTPRIPPTPPQGTPPAAPQQGTATSTP